MIKSEFSSAHLYKNENFTVAENRKYFGRCYTDHGHGHNYKLEVGFSIPLNASENDLIKAKMKWNQTVEKLTTVLDHEHLNFVVPEFKTTIPTTENILLYFEKKITDLKIIKSVVYLKLFEMDNLWSEKYYVTK